MLMSKYLFSLVLILSILFGLLLPGVSLIWKDYQVPLLALLMLFSVLRVEKDELGKSNAKELIILLLFVFVAMPLLSLLFRPAEPLIFFGVLVALSAPSAAATAFFASVLGGDIALGVTISFLTSLLSVLTLPLTIQTIVGASLPVDNSKLLMILAEVILAPTVIALLLKKFFREMTEKINRYRDYQLAVLFLLGSSIIGTGQGVISGRELQFVMLTIQILVLLVLGGAVAYLFGMRYGKKTAITFFVATSVKNAMLSFELVFELFGPIAVLPMVANLVAQQLLMIFLEVLGDRL